MYKHVFLTLKYLSQLKYYTSKVFPLNLDLNSFELELILLAAAQMAECEPLIRALCYARAYFC